MYYYNTTCYFYGNFFYTSNYLHEFDEMQQHEKCIVQSKVKNFEALGHGVLLCVNACVWSHRVSIATISFYNIKKKKIWLLDESLKDFDKSA